MQKTKEEKFITVKIRGKEIKKDKKGRDYFSIQTAIGEWYSCWVIELFETLAIGFKGTVIIESNGEFRQIIDVLADEMGVIPKKTLPTKNPTTSEVSEDIHAILERIEKSLGIIARFIGAEI